MSTAARKIEPAPFLPPVDDDGMRRRLAEAPIDDEPVTPEEEALVAEALASLARGEKGLTTEELLRDLGL